MSTPADTFTDRTGATDEEFRARVAVFDAAEEPEGWEQRVEVAARAIAEVDGWRWNAGGASAVMYRRLAAAALTADAALAGQPTTDEPCSAPSHGADTPCVLPDGHAGGCLR